jgi:predicted Holliday junction resolvase-like endonuclease
MKIILLILLLFFACVIAMTLLTRLLKTTQQLASLRGDLTRNSQAMQEQLRALQQAQAAQEAQQGTQQMQQDATLDSRELDPRVLEARERSKEEPKEL